MTELFTEVLEVFTLLLGGWVTIFGATNAIFAQRRGYSPLAGLLLGGLLGPGGWIVVWARTIEPSGEEEVRYEQAVDKLWEELR
jgi:hypothetical protein